MRYCQLCNQHCKCGKSQTAQGERSATLGISPLNSHYDSHRVVGVSLETGGIVVAMTVPKNHCIGEYAIPYRNAISVNAGLRQCCSISYPQGYAALTLGCLTLAAP